ncbi:MAG: SDR family oxidoreductase [Pseudomonadota bacterium]
MKNIILITGMGAMGLACARTLGSGHHLLLADNDASRIDHAIQDLTEEGYDVSGCRLDLGQAESAHALADEIRKRGQLKAMVHTAAISQSQAPMAERIYDVNLVGTATLIEVMQKLAGPGTVGVVIASMGAQFISIPAEVERRLALAPLNELKDAICGLPGYDDKNMAYLIAKRGNQLRVEAESLTWATTGARLISISPGVISTAQGRQEMREHPEVAKIVNNCPAQRIGTPQDIANAVDWLISRHASFITGIDLRVDGGTIASQRWQQ